MTKQSTAGTSDAEARPTSFWDSTQGFLTKLAAVLAALVTIVGAVKALWPVHISKAPTPTPPATLISTINIPPFRGSTMKDAEEWLAQAGFKYQELPKRLTSTVPDPIPPGSVAAQEPSAGALLPGQTILLTPEADWVPVPDLGEQILSEATTALVTDKLTVGVITNQIDGKPVNEGAGKWKVVNQSPAPNSVAKPLAVVTLTCQMVPTTYVAPQMKLLIRPQFLNLSKLKASSVKQP